MTQCYTERREIPVHADPFQESGCKVQLPLNSDFQSSFCLH